MKKGKRSPARKKGQANPPAAAKEASAPPARPLKPRPVLLAVLGILFALWMVGLLALYFGRVRPMRHPASRTASALAGWQPCANGRH